VDDVIQYTYTTLSSIPGVLLIAAAVLILQVYMDSNQELFDTVAARADIRLLFLCVILGITSWTGLCRLLRGETLKVREMEFIQAANGIWRRPFPHHRPAYSAQRDAYRADFYRAGFQCPGAGRGSIVLCRRRRRSGHAELGQHDQRRASGNGTRTDVWWSLLAAFVFMFVLVLSANLFSDRVRDAFDPRVR